MSEAKEVPTEPYSLENLARIINALAIKGLPVLESKDIELSIEHAKANTGRQVTSELYFIGWLQGMALEFLLNREFEGGARFTGARKILQHIAAADFEALPASIYHHLLPSQQLRALRPILRQIRERAASQLDSLPKRGALHRGQMEASLKVCFLFPVSLERRLSGFEDIIDRDFTLEQQGD